MKLEINVDLPPELLDQIPAGDLSNLCRTEIVIHLYAEGKLSAGAAAEFAGLTRLQFLDLLRERGVGFLVELDPDDFRQIDDIRLRYTPKAG